MGNVVLNRKNKEYWPDTVYGVVFDRRCGVQFSPTTTDAIYANPMPSAVIAAKLAMEGANTAGDSLFFLNEAVANNSWFANNLDYVTTIQHHTFYTTEID